MNQKLILFSIISILATVVSLAFMIGPDRFFLLVGAILFITYTLGLIGLGFWLGQNSFKEGAKITLEAQRVNDEWDVNKTQALSRFGTEVVRMARMQQVDPGYPPLLEMGSGAGAIEGDFIMTGFEDGEE